MGGIGGPPGPESAFERMYISTVYATMPLLLPTIRPICSANVSGLGALLTLACFAVFVRFAPHILLYLRCFCRVRPDWVRYVFSDAI